MRETTKWVVIASLFIATAGFAREGGIRCEVQKIDVRNDSMLVVCPPPSAFSPIRVRIVLAAIDHFGWSKVELQSPAQVELLQTKLASQIAVRLPHEDGTRRWLAWRLFSKITTIAIVEGN